MAKKNTKKTYNVDITVDLTNAETMHDVYVAFAEAKINKYITHNESDALIEDVVDKYGFHVCICNGECSYCKKEEKAKKPNIFKRFWNWLTK